MHRRLEFRNWRPNSIQSIRNSDRIYDESAGRIVKYSVCHNRISVAATVFFALALCLMASSSNGECLQETTDSTDVLLNANADPVLAEATKTLARHQVPLTADGMRKRLQRLDPRHPSHQQLEEQASVFVKDLNSADYLVRENATQSLKLMTTVPKAQLAAAIAGKDPEVAYRAQAILEYVKSRNRRDTDRGIIESVCVVVQAKQIKGMTSVLLETLKNVQEPMTRTTIANAIAATAEETDVDQLRSALHSENVSQRIASSVSLLKLLGSDATEELRQRLGVESNDQVRISIARSLANIGIRDSLSVLVELLDSDELAVRVESGQVLRAVTDQRLGFVAYESEDKRKPSVEKWQAWLAADGESVKLQFPILDKHLAFGRILYADYKLNKAVEVDMNGEEVWSVDFKSAWNVQGLPNGHRLVSSYSGRTVVEFDRNGKEVWKLARTPSELMGLHRLDNGNTLVGCGPKVVEYQQDGTSVWEAKMTGRVSHCQRLSNGNTLVALFDRNSVVEINPKQQTVWSIDTAQNPMSAHRTNAGTTLIATLSDGTVNEYDQEKRVVWQFKTASGNSGVQRLPNGDTLINSKTQIQLVRPDGKTRWTIKGLKHSFGLSVY